MKKITTLIIGIVILNAGLVFAEVSAPTQQAGYQTANKLVEVGNKFCPVSGEQVGKMGPAIKFVYNGKIYNLCCPMCKKDFIKDPAKFSKIAEDCVAKFGKYEGK